MVSSSSDALSYEPANRTAIATTAARPPHARSLPRPATATISTSGATKASALKWK